MSFDELITHIKKYPYLWNKAHPLYRRGDQRDLAWHCISKDMGVNERYLRKRWKHLKDSFRKQYKQLLESGTPDLDRVPKSWKHFKALSFLIDGYYTHLKPKNKDNAVTSSDTESESDNWSVTSSTNLPQKQNDENVVPETSINTGNIDAESLNDDADFMFLKSIVPSMKNLTDLQKLQFKGKVNDWLLEFYKQNEWTPGAGSHVYLQTAHPIQHDVNITEHINLDSDEDVKPVLIE